VEARRVRVTTTLLRILASLGILHLCRTSKCASRLLCWSITIIASTASAAAEGIEAIRIRIVSKAAAAKPTATVALAPGMFVLAIVFDA
jgi:hypothetical protein